METRVFNNKKELAIALLNGEKWILKGVNGFCCFIEEENIRIESKIPFRYINEEEKVNTEIDGFWACADGISTWEKIK